MELPRSIKVFFLMCSSCRRRERNMCFFCKGKQDTYGWMLSYPYFKVPYICKELINSFCSHSFPIPTLLFLCIFKPTTFIIALGFSLVSWPKLSPDLQTVRLHDLFNFYHYSFMTAHFRSQRYGNCDPSHLYIPAGGHTWAQF